MTTHAPLSLILQTGELDRLHYGLLTAITAASLDRPVHILVTFAACRAFVKAPDFGQFPISSGLSGIAENASAWCNYCNLNNIPLIPALLELAASLPITFTLCDMGARAAGVKETDLTPVVQFKRGGLVQFCANQEGQWLMI